MMCLSLNVAVVVAAVGAIIVDDNGGGANEAVRGDDGITLNTYTNMAFSGPPASTTVLPSTSFLIPGDQPGSAELVGSIAFPPHGAVYHFDCRWEKVDIL